MRVTIFKLRAGRPPSFRVGTSVRLDPRRAAKLVATAECGGDVSRPVAAVTRVSVSHRKGSDSTFASPPMHLLTKALTSWFRHLNFVARQANQKAAVGSRSRLNAARYREELCTLPLIQNRLGLQASLSPKKLPSLGKCVFAVKRSHHGVTRRIWLTNCLIPVKEIGSNICALGLTNAKRIARIKEFQR